VFNPTWYQSGRRVSGTGVAVLVLPNSVLARDFSNGRTIVKKKHHNPGAVPPGNKPHAGPGLGQDEADNYEGGEENAGASFQEQDPKRRLGDFSGAGEHSRKQPSRLNDGDTHSQ